MLTAPLAATRVTLDAAIPPGVDAPSMLIGGFLALHVLPLAILHVPLGPIGCLLDVRVLNASDSRAASMGTRLAWLLAHTAASMLAPVLLFGSMRALLGAVDGLAQPA